MPSFWSDPILFGVLNIPGDIVRMSGEQFWNQVWLYGPIFCQNIQNYARKCVRPKALPNFTWSWEPIYLHYNKNSDHFWNPLLKGFQVPDLKIVLPFLIGAKMAIKSVRAEKWKKWLLWQKPFYGYFHAISPHFVVSPTQPWPHYVPGCKETGLEVIRLIPVGLFPWKSKNVKIIFQPSTVFPAPTGQQNCDLGIIQHRTRALRCWIIPRSRFHGPVWAGKTVEHLVWICGYSVRQAICQSITRVILEKSQRSWWTKIILH